MTEDNFDKTESKDKAAGRAKRGALSKIEKEFIAKNAATMTATELADKIGKSEATIRRYVYKSNIVVKGEDGHSDDEKSIRLKKLLRSRPYWSDLKLSFGPDEIKTFEETWINIFKQFDEDVTQTEELQIKKHISLEIFRDRHLKKSFTIEKQLEELNKTLEQEYAKPADQKNLEAIKELSIMTDKLQNNQISINKEINAIVDKQKDTEKALKGSRDQRVKEFVDAEKNWVSAIRLLQKPDILEQVGKHIELMKIAQQAQRNKMYDFHNFYDKSVDRLILSSESLELAEQEEREEQEKGDKDA